VKAAALPVDLARLRDEFPDLSEEDLQAFAAVTERVLRDPASKARVLREVMMRARQARDRQASGEPIGLDADEQEALRYLRALEKMQRPVSQPH
jgi:hypothetical protein